MSANNNHEGGKSQPGCDGLVAATSGAGDAGAFTSGPWSIPQPWSGFTAIKGPNGELIFGLAAGAGDERQSPAVCEANSHLIAAAPDLLAALVETRRLVSEAAMSGFVDEAPVRALFVNNGSITRAIARALGQPTGGDQ